MKSLKRRSGFTLIEIIVVLIIIGILVAIAVTVLFSNIAKSRAEEALANISGIKPVILGCESGQFGSEANCTLTYMYQTTPTSTNFSYVLGLPANGNSGWTITATGVAAAVGGTVTTTQASAANTAPLGAITNSCSGNLMGAC